MKAPFVRSLRASLVVLLAVAALATTAETVKADRYVVPPNNASAVPPNPFGSTMHLRTIVADPIYAGDSTTIAYHPSQYLILSPTPTLSLSIKGGYLGCDDWPNNGWTPPDTGGCFKTLTASNGLPYHSFPPRGDRLEEGSLDAGHRFVWEFYQLQDTTRRAGIPIGGSYAQIDSRWQSFWGTNSSGDADGDWKNLFFNGVNGATYQGMQFPQFRGWYVFLVKQVHEQDQDQGYVDTISGIEGSPSAIAYGTGCVYNGPSLLDPRNNIKCPTAWRKSTFEGNSVAALNSSRTVAQNAHYIKVPDSEMIMSAPSKMAINTRYNIDNNNNSANGYGFRVNTDGTSCSRNGTGGANQYSIFNIDMDRYQEGYGIYDDPALRTTFPGRGTFYNTDYGTGYPGRYPFSDGWTSGGSFMYLPAANVLPETGSHIMNFLGLNAGNNMYLGGQFLTTGPVPGCATVGITPLTPKAQSAGYLYNGQDSETLINGAVQTNLDFSFQYQLSGAGAAYARQADWFIEIDGVTRLTGRDGPPGTAVHVRTLPQFPIGDLPPGVHNWRACVTSASQPVCTALTTFKINMGPIAETVSPTPGDRLNYNLCVPLRARITDPDQNTWVGARFNVSWTDSRGSHIVQTRDNSIEKQSSPGVAADFSSDDVFAESWTIDGEPEEIDFDGDSVADTDITLTRFLREQLSSGEGVTLNWSVRGYDVTAASDLDTEKRTYSAVVRQLGLYNQDPLQPEVDDFRWGRPASSSFYRKSAPTFSRDQTGNKKFYSPADAGNTTQLKTLTDGTTVKVVTTIRNFGETPTGHYFVRDYLGPVRDWEPPDPNSVSLTMPDGTNRKVNPPDVARMLKPVVVRDTQNPDDPVSGDQEPPEAGTPTSEQTWRFDLGGNLSGEGILNEYLAPAELQPNDAITLTYTIRANRNRDLIYGDFSANYGNTTRVGNDASELDARPAPPQTTEGGTPDVSRAHTWVRFQVDYCDAGLFDDEVLDNTPGSILAPYVRGGRGSVGTNQNIQAYDSLGEKNATFTVTAGGSVKHFTSGAGDPMQGYRSSAACRPDGGIDWRTEMTKNIERVKGERHLVTADPNFNGNGSVAGRQAGFTRELDFNKVEGRVIEFDNFMRITAPLQIKGTGTLLVNGDLFINANMIYAPDNTRNSLGIIVLGHIYVDPAVTQIVGSYFASDVEWTGDRAARVNGCPKVDISEASGWIHTGESDKQLNVDGLMVARKFVLQRYYTDLSQTKRTAAAENVLFDGRVLSQTPPAFDTFLKPEWYEIIPN